MAGDFFASAAREPALPGGDGAGRRTAGKKVAGARGLAGRQDGWGGMEQREIKQPVGWSGGGDKRKDRRRLSFSGKTPAALREWRLSGGFGKPDRAEG